MQLNCQYSQLIILKAGALFHEQAMEIYLQKHIYLNLNSSVKPQTPIPWTFQVYQTPSQTCWGSDQNAQGVIVFW